MIQKIECQERLWVFESNDIWDGVGYPTAEKVWACLLSNDAEYADLTEFYARKLNESSKQAN